MKPYTQVKSNDIIERIFTPDIEEEELVWHRDEKDREVRVIGDTDWMFQFDNDLPISFRHPIYISKGVIHRVIKGTGPLHIVVHKKKDLDI